MHHIKVTQPKEFDMNLLKRIINLRVPAFTMRLQKLYKMYIIVYNVFRTLSNNK